MLKHWLTGICLALFTLAAPAAPDGQAVVADIQGRGARTVADYRPDDPLPTATALSSLYFDVFETSGMELDIGMRDAGLKAEIELRFGALNAGALQGIPADQLQGRWLHLSETLDEAKALYAQGSAEAGFMSVLLMSMLILLREGLEAILIVAALATYMRRAGAADRIWVLYVGVGVALPLSLLTGWSLARSLRASGASQATMEGVVMLLASAVLIYVSVWMISKRESRRWQAWVAGQLDSALSRGSLFALGLTACLAVYREGAETVLFYEALRIANRGQDSAILTGLGVAVAVLGGLYMLIRQASLRLPFHRLFAGTALLLYGLAVIFVGQAVLELQAAGHVPVTPLVGVPQIQWLGLAPTFEGVVAQGGLLVLPLLLVVFLLRRDAGGGAARRVTEPVQVK